LHRIENYPFDSPERIDSNRIFPSLSNQPLGLFEPICSRYRNDHFLWWIGGRTTWDMRWVSGVC